MFFPLQIDDDAGSLLCTYLIILVVILIGLYAGLYAFNRFFSSRKAKQHPCKYCGHIVDAVSDCHHAPVEERFMGGKCAKCRKDCKIICAKCRRPLH